MALGRLRCAALVVASLAYAVAWNAADPADHVLAVVDSSSLLQMQVSDSARSDPKNLVVFYDGTFQDHSGNAWKIVQNLIQDNVTQMVWYEPGVEDFWGTGVRAHSIRGYKFLAENYNEGDHIFVFGQSRGALSARYLQGLLHRFGLVKRLPLVDWDAYFQDHASLESALSGRIFELDTTVHVEAMGLVDGVLRVLWQKDTPFESLDLRPLHLELTSKVRNLFHALALEEVADYMQAAELVTDASTFAEQVWFMGDHLQMCTNNDIMISWLMDRMKTRGLLVQKDFGASLNLQPLEGSPYRVKIQKDTVIRNPGACRKELYGDTPPKIHVSVKDRMEGVGGWKPETYCCHPEVLKGDVTWVSTPTYVKWKVEGYRIPQWVLLKLHVSAGASPYPRRYIIVVTDHGNMVVDVGTGPLAELHTDGLFPFHIFETEPRVPGMVPPALLAVEGPCNCTSETTFGIAGRNYRVFGGGILHRGELVGDFGPDMLVSLETELLFDDFAPVSKFSMPLCARCSWLYINTEKRYNGTVCPTKLPRSYPSTCDELHTEATVGICHSSEAAKRVKSWYMQAARFAAAELSTDFSEHELGDLFKAMEKRRPFLREDLAATLQNHLETLQEEQNLPANTSNRHTPSEGSGQ
mmetsp:Transcript_27986/g.65312  ORF Transcript_27986/g.65312 Transcript_27986/m.65312 type:complete len:638 (-) Transcript_27986:97-2010(-)